ncbi:MAG: orotate phosphoribosyltransferase [Candidatus Zixiibacteriota bacterium]
MTGGPQAAVDALERLRAGLNRYALKRGRFVLASGAISDYYVNVKEICLRGEYLRLVGELLWAKIKRTGADAVGGLTLGADPIVAAVTIAAADDGVDCSALIIRKELKDHGTGQRIEGPFQPGMRVAVVEDVTTTGASAKSAADAIIAAGGIVVGVFSVLNRAAGADGLFAAQGWPFDALFGTKDLDL